jgi:hypothetical protein
MWTHSDAFRYSQQAYSSSPSHVSAVVLSVQSKTGALFLIKVRMWL